MEANLVKRKDRWDLYNEDGHKIASTLGGCNIKLSLKNCQAIELGYDLNELAKSSYPWEDEGNKEDYIQDQRRYGFVKGAKTIIKLFSNKNAELLKNLKDLESGLLSFSQSVNVSYLHLDCKEIIQSLQQTEWDVEVVMEEIQEIYRDGTTKYERVPKLDVGGCIVLKRKQINK